MKKDKQEQKEVLSKKFLSEQFPSKHSKKNAKKESRVNKLKSKHKHDLRSNPKKKKSNIFIEMEDDSGEDSDEEYVEDTNEDSDDDSDEAMDNSNMKKADRKLNPKGKTTVKSSKKMIEKEKNKNFFSDM